MPPAKDPWRRIGGEHFVEVMTAIASWGDVVLIVHTKDAVVEVHGPLPQGNLGHGFYNLRGGGAVSGHLKADNCRAIVFLRRPFVGKDTAGVQFFNAGGRRRGRLHAGRNGAGRQAGRRCLQYQRRRGGRGASRRAGVALLIERVLRDTGTLGGAFAAVDLEEARCANPIQPFPLAP
jgi:putative heme utilization carrier protein HutX